MMAALDDALRVLLPEHGELTVGAVGVLLAFGWVWVIKKFWALILGTLPGLSRYGPRISDRVFGWLGYERRDAR